MLAFIRFIGVAIAAVWLGSIVFVTIAAGPAFFSPEMIRLLGKPYAGAAAEIVLQRYFTLQLWCAILALVHLIADWLYSGRPLSRGILVLLICLLGVGLIGGYVLQPKLKQLHLIMYATQSTAQEKEAARKEFGMLHGISQTINLAVLGGVLAYLWHIQQSSNTVRFASLNKFKS